MKELPLTKGFVALIDDADFAALSKHKWRASISGNGKVYARTDIWENGRKLGSISMHRFLLKPSKTMEVDHIDQNSLNNQRCNLRAATHAQNLRNRGKDRDNQSGFKGVHHHRHKTWIAAITVDGKRLHLGSFNTAEHAYEAYCNAAQIHHKNFARTA
jgi:hypothetical protein